MHGDVSDDAASPLAAREVDVESTGGKGRRSSQTRRFRSFLVGVLYIVLVAVIWTGASVLVQAIYTDFKFDAPWFLTYVCTSLFGLYLPVWRSLRSCGLVRPTAKAPSETFLEEVALRRRLKRSTSGEDEETVLVAPEAASDGGVVPLAMGNSSVMSGKAHLSLALMIWPLWFIANATYNVSLDLTSVTNSTILSTTSSIFTFLFGLLCGEEKLRYVSVAGVLCTFGGVVITTLSDAESGTKGESFKGDLICLVGSIFYGAYTTALKVYSPGDEDMSTSLMLGYMGCVNAVFLLPGLIAVIFTHFEPLDKLSWAIFGLLVLKGVLDNVLSDYLWMKAVLLTSPTIATVGLSLTVPMAFVADFLFKAQGPPDVGAVVGSLMVLGGFILVTVVSPRDEDRERDRENSAQSLTYVQERWASFCSSLQLRFKPLSHRWYDAMSTPADEKDDVQSLVHK